MNKKRIWPAVCVALVAFLAVLLVVTCAQNNQSRKAMPVPVQFVGQYSQNGGAWQPLTSDIRLNALEGDLALRGHFDFPVKLLFVYLDHIYRSVSVNGEVVVDNLPETQIQLGCRPDCGSTWETWDAGSLSEQDEIEIHLMNTHTLGNPQAYTEFLHNLYNGTEASVSDFVLHPSDYLATNLRAQMEGLPSATYLLNGEAWRGAGFVALVLSVFLLGIALADALQKSLLGFRLWWLSFFALFFSGSMVLDTLDVSLWSQLISFNTYASQLCRMLAALFLVLSTVELLTGRCRKLAHILATVEAALIGGIGLVCLIGKTLLCETVTVWLVAQACVFGLLLACAMWAFCSASNVREKHEQAAQFVLFAAVLLELCNARFGWWQRSLMLNMVFLVLCFLYLARIALDVPKKYHEAMHAEQLERDLVQSRITIMLSQIQPHFLYNSLNSIGYLCEKDPPAAKMAVDDFAAYLRGNLDSLKRTKPIPFEKELEHVRIYLSLEKMRFDEDLNIVWDVQATDFMVPALTIQPLVENAVKYGVGKKTGGGTVTISCTECLDHFEVVISDDGVGYDPAVTQEDGRTHVGVDSVRARLACMVGGTLTINSEPGKGTTATITIPKGGAER